LVVYVDNDPLVMAHARALLTSTDEGCCDYLHADLRDTEYILREAARTLDFTQPVAVLLLAVLHFVPDADDPPGIVAALAAGLAPCSFVAISHLTADLAPEAVGKVALGGQGRPWRQFAAFDLLAKDSRSASCPAPGKHPAATSRPT
jgi:hypothetical protein